jgi:hypothetical protein
MTWLTVMKYICPNRPRISSTCRKHFPFLSSFTTYYCVCEKSNTTGDTNEAGTYIEEEQKTQWPKEKVPKDKQRSTKNSCKTKNRVTRTPLITRVNSGAPEG